MSTIYHAAYYAAELTKRISSDDAAKLGVSLFNATVDLNPHQVDAALFAFRSPLSRGAILADEVGLGKTVEAGLVISQLWAERKRRVLVIAPTILRKQWAQELVDKFFIDSIVLDRREMTLRERRQESVFEPADNVVIVSYHFAAKHFEELSRHLWDLVVIDEAHRLRNVYKSGNRIARAIRDAVRSQPILLLTATPLQNNLMELYGLVTFIDDKLFGDPETFRSRYMRGPMEDRELADLRTRLLPVCKRTLRRQVNEFIQFTKRVAITQDFTPSDAEQNLYDRVSEYLRRKNLYALPVSQRKLITLVLRKLLASSTFAISHTLDSLAVRLQDENQNLLKTLSEEYDSLDEEEDEWQGEDDDPELDEPLEPNPKELREEIQELQDSGALAHSITVNAKGDALLIALERGFIKLLELGAQQKAVIFTESRRTQAYLFDLLTRQGYDGRVMTISGVNNDERSTRIYKEWVERHKGEPVVTGNKQVDLRAALVEEFRERADILVATEAAAEGVNLQFCSLVVNYDLPWNPQRIEQRIGRCHRYGQKHDVVVVNFINRANAADQRVYELLSEKFKLFDGVFGSSDEVLGALESGVDFERRIADIYQAVRTREEIDEEFNLLRIELDDQIIARMADTRHKLLENFDEEVRRKLKVSYDQAKTELDHLERCLWNLTRFELGSSAEFHEGGLRGFVINEATEKYPAAEPGHYELLSRAGGEMLPGNYRQGHPLAQELIGVALKREKPFASVVFDYTGHGEKIGLVESLVGQSGWLRLDKLTVETDIKSEDHLLFSLLTEQGEVPDSDVGNKLFQVTAQLAEESPEIDIPPAVENRVLSLESAKLQEIGQRNSEFFDAEVEKLDRWADDLKNSLEVELKSIDQEINKAKKERTFTASLEDKLEVLKRIGQLEAARKQKRKELFEAQDEIEQRKDTLIEETQAKLRQKTKRKTLFSIRWMVL